MTFLNVFGFLLNFSASWKIGVKEQWPKKSLFQLFRLNVVICHLRPKRGWNIFETLKTCQMTELQRKTKLNMFSVLDAQIRSFSSKQSKLNFWNRLNPIFAFLCRLLTQTATWQPNQPILTSRNIAILKAMTNTLFFLPSLGLVRIFHLLFEVFSTRESTLKLTARTFSWRDSQVEN